MHASDGWIEPFLVVPGKVCESDTERLRQSVEGTTRVDRPVAGFVFGDCTSTHAGQVGEHLLRHTAACPDHSNAPTDVAAFLFIVHAWPLVVTRNLMLIGLFRSGTVCFVFQVILGICPRYRVQDQTTDRGQIMGYSERAPLPIRLPMRSQAIEIALHIWEVGGSWCPGRWMR